MKILMVNKFFYIKGGSETYYFALKRKLEKEGHIVIDFSMKDKKNFESKYADYFVDNVDYSGSTSLINKLKINKFEKISRARYDQMKKDSFDMFEECYTPNGHYDKLMKIYEKAQRKHGE